MTDQEKLEAYQERSPSHSLSSAINDLAVALMYAVRADTNLHWLRGADTWLSHAENKIAEYRSFVAALDADDTTVSKMVSAHRAKVAAACATITDEVSA